MLGTIPQRIVDDAQLRHFLDNPFGLWIEPRHSPACIRILDVAETIPHQASDLELVVDYPRAAVDVAADRRIHPDVAARTRHALGVEVARDGTRTLAVSKLTEDAANDHGLALVDRALAADQLAVADNAVGDVIAKAEPAAGLAFLDAAPQAAAGPLGGVLPEQGVQSTLEADLAGRN